jgi:Uma2 family endonuclease
MAMPAESAKRWTAAEARRLNEENPLPWPYYEVIDGELLVSAAPRYLHQRAVHRLLLLLGAYLDSRPAFELLPGPADIELEPDSTLSPDLFVFPRVEGRRVRHWSEVTSLVMVAEILSPSTARNDRVKKRDYFMRNDVAEYWIVDLDARVVERWRRGETRPEILSNELAWQPDEASAPLVINLIDYFAHVCDD